MTKMKIAVKKKETIPMKKKTPKQIAALICVVLLVSMYIITFIAAFLDTPGSGKLFAACLASTIGLPILLWIFIWFFGLSKEHKSVAQNSLTDGNTTSDREASVHTARIEDKTSE